MAYYNDKKDKDKEPNMKLVMKVGDPTEGHPEVTVFVAIDTSGSMSGEKINQVFSSIQDLITKAPGYVRFVIRKFDREVKTIVSKKKRYLDVGRLGVDLKKCGDMTALFDAWGQVINEIPYDVSKLDAAYVLIFTDGEDNYSKTFSLESITVLVNEKMSEKVRLIFIQAGPHTKVANAIEAGCSKQFCTVIKVEDSVPGIDYGFRQAKQHIQFEINVDQAGFLARIGGLTLSSRTGSKHSHSNESSGRNLGIGSAIRPTLTLSKGPELLPARNPSVYDGPVPFRRTYAPIHRNGRHVRMQPPPELYTPGQSDQLAQTKPKTVEKKTADKTCQSTLQKGTLVEKISAVKNMWRRSAPVPRSPSSIPPESKPKENGKLRDKHSGPQPVCPSAGTANATPAKQSKHYWIIVSGIPFDIVTKFPTKPIADLLLEFFRQWGKCEVKKVGTAPDSTMRAKITYEVEAETILASHYGQRTYFHGTLLTIRNGHEEP